MRLRLIKSRTLHILEDEIRELRSDLETAYAVRHRMMQQRNDAWSLIHALSREGAMPTGAWQRHANCMTESESGGEIERDQIRADQLRARLNAPPP